jgi:hypothetical protein
MDTTRPDDIPDDVPDDSPDDAPNVADADERWQPKLAFNAFYRRRPDGKLSAVWLREDQPTLDGFQPCEPVDPGDGTPPWLSVDGKRVDGEWDLSHPLKRMHEQLRA